MIYTHVCHDCAGGTRGCCAQCDGTGINPHLNSSEPKCPACRGTGVCPACGGSGRPTSISDPGIQKLFE